MGIVPMVPLIRRFRLIRAIDDPRHLKPRGQYQDDGPDKIGQHVTDSWYQSKQRIEPQIDACARNSDGRIQNLGQKFGRRQQGFSLRLGSWRHRGETWGWVSHDVTERHVL